MKDIIVKSFAKVNIGLQVRSKRNDQYHNIQTIFQEINFYDSLKVTKINKGIDFKSNVSWLKNDDSNLCVKAYKKMRSISKVGGIRIDLIKRIPAYAGLGGGSSNAASVLNCINKLYNLKFSSQYLEIIGSRLGADVPFFINGGIQLSEGKGERLSTISMDLNKYYILLVLPEFSISTKWAYSFFKNDLCKRFDSNKFRSFQQCVDWALFENDFEEVINLTYPEVGQIRETLESKEALFVSLSGSGSAMFGIFDNFLNADLAHQALKTYKSHIVRTINRV